MENKKIRLEERLPKLFRSTVNLSKKYEKELIAKRIIPQLVASIGSIGANYQEATMAMSKKDFIKCLKIARKEAAESLLWLVGFDEISQGKDPQVREITQEVKEIGYILSSIISKASLKTFQA